MPRARRGVGAARQGVKVPGIYEDLLRRERERFAGAPHRLLCRPARSERRLLRRRAHLLEGVAVGQQASPGAGASAAREMSRSMVAGDPR